MRRWEYCTVTVNSSHHEMEEARRFCYKVGIGCLNEALNHLGLEGWEHSGTLGSASVASAVLVFKRPMGEGEQ